MFQVSSIFLHVKEAQRIHLLQALSVSSGATRTAAEGGDFTFLFEMKRKLEGKPVWGCFISRLQK